MRGARLQLRTFLSWPREELPRAVGVGWETGEGWGAMTGIIERPHVSGQLDLHLTEVSGEQVAAWKRSYEDGGSERVLGRPIS